MTNNFDPVQPIPGARLTELFDQAQSSFNDSNWLMQSAVWLYSHPIVGLAIMFGLVIMWPVFFFGLTRYALHFSFKGARVTAILAIAITVALVIALIAGMCWVDFTVHGRMAEFATQPVHDWISWRYGIVVDHDALEEALRVASYDGDSLAGSSHELEGTEYALSFSPISGDVTLVGVNSGHEMMTRPNLASE